MAYTRFFLMIATSTVVMFGLMYLNTYLVGHAFFSETRVYMAILMGAVMAIVMLSFMLSMYKSRGVNIAIYVGAFLVLGIALYLMRSQVTVQDRSFMKAMIPHHSIAIMTSSRAKLSDSRVRHLADSIVFAQDKEIAEMRYLIADIEQNGERHNERAPSAAQLTEASEALATEVLPSIDPEFMSPEEIDVLFPEGGDCRFTYTNSGAPVLVAGRDAALMRISGDLVKLEPQGAKFVAGPLTANVKTTSEENLYDLIVSAGPDYKAGFRGQYSCTPEPRD